MKTFTRRLCAALTGISVLMTGMCVPQFTAAATDTAALASEVPADSILLKTVSGILRDDLQEQEITLTAGELGGKTYTRIDAVVEYVSPMYNRVPDSAYAPLYMQFEVGRNTMEGDRRDFKTVDLSVQSDTGKGTVFHSFNRCEEAFGTYSIDTLNLELLMYRRNNTDTEMLPAGSGEFNLKLYGSTEEENYDYPEVTPLTCCEEKVLKEVCGDISDMHDTVPASLSLTYDELNGQTYDAIYAEVFFTPDEEAELSEDQYRYATGAYCEYAVQTYIEADTESNTDAHYEVETDSDCLPLYRSPGKYHDPYAEFEVCRGFSENQELFFVVVDFIKELYLFRDEQWFNVRNGMYAIRLIGRNFTANHMPPADDLTLLGEAECEVRAGTASFELPPDLFYDRYYADFYVTAEYTQDPNVSVSGAQPAYVALNFIGERRITRYNRNTAGENAIFNCTTEIAGTGSDSYVPFNLSENSTCFTAAEIKDCGDFFRLSPSFIRETKGVDPPLVRKPEMTGNVYIDCDLYADFGRDDIMSGGTVTLKVYGYDPFGAPPVEDMYPLLCTDGKFAATDRKEIVLTEDQCFPDYYVTVNGHAGDQAKIHVILYRDADPDSEELVKFYETEMTTVLIDQFGMQKIDFESLGIQPQAGDKIALSAGLGCSDGSIPNGGYIGATLYGVDPVRKLLILDGMTLLGETETDLSADAEKLKIGFDKMHETGYTNIYAVAEFDGDADSVWLQLEETQYIYISANTPGGPVIIEPNLTQSTETAELQSGTAIIDLGRDDHRNDDGFVEISPKAFKGEEEVTDGTVKLKVYGYNRFGMPLYSEMKWLKAAYSPVAAASGEIVADGTFDRLWFETEYDGGDDLYAEFLIKVYHGGKAEGQEPDLNAALEAPLVNGFAAVSASTAEFGIKPGDVVWVRVNYFEKAGGKKAYLDGGSYAEMNIYSCAQQKKGDVSCDGTIDVSDAVLLARFIAEDAEAEITEQGKQNADVNKSGSPDQEDIVLILRRIARLIPDF